jgi:L-lactate dehydrogenase (cytochrome)
VRSRWPGKLILKGVLDAEDAKLALTSGADAIVVSNHGGRQLDGAPSTIAVLPEIAAAIAGRCEVLFDGGVRSGQDVLKAVALGAQGVLIGKSFLYALAAMGEAGVTRALEIIQRELRVTTALVGRNSMRGLDAGVLRRQPPEMP